MIWAIVNSWFCFCWLYRASLSLAGKNIINLISVSTIWWCPCVESSLAFLKEGVCYDQCVLLTKSLLAFALLILYSKAKFACYSRYLLSSYFCIPVLWWKGHLFWILVLEGLVGIIESFNFSFFSINGWDIDLDYWDVEWFVLETNRDHSVTFEIASKYCISDSFCWVWWILHFF